MVQGLKRQRLKFPQNLGWAWWTARSDSRHANELIRETISGNQAFCTAGFKSADSNSYHVRTGKHGVTDFDWTQYMNFASRHWGK